MRAKFEIIANGSNITDLIRDRLLELKVTDKPKVESDTCEIKLDDRDGKIAFPKKGATLKISLGWSGAALNYLGTYTVDEIEISGPPQTIVIRGKPSSMRKEAKGHRNKSYESTTLKSVVGEIATRNGWQAACDMDIEVPRADQIGESDIHFVTRLARLHDATAQVKDGKLIVLPRGGGKSASGKSLAATTITPEMCMQWRFAFPDRAGHAGVKTKAHDNKKGAVIEVKIDNPDAPPGSDAVHVDRHTYPNQAAAKAAAKSRLAQLNRATCNGEFTIGGSADFAAEKNVALSGFKDEVDGTYLAESVTHTFADNSWITRVEVNAGNQGKAKVGHGKKGKKGKPQGSTYIVS